MRAKAVEPRHPATRGDSEDRSTATVKTGNAVRPPSSCRSVKVPIGCLDQVRQGEAAVRAVGARAKIVKRRQRAGRSDFENRSATIAEAGRQIGPASLRCPIEIPIAGLDQRAIRPIAVTRVEAQQRRELAACGDFEDRSTAARAGNGVPAARRYPVKASIGGLDIRLGHGAIHVVESVDCRKRLSR